MGKQVTAGYGDPCTWGPYLGHPNDPRTPTPWEEEDEEEEEEENEL